MRFFKSNNVRQYQTYELNGYFPSVCVTICFNCRGQKQWTRYFDAENGYDLTEDDLILREM